MKGKGIYQVKSSEKEIKEYTLSVLTEDKAGLLNHITIIFNRRKININSLNVSTTEVNGVSRFTIVVNSSKEKIVKVVNHINKLIEVLGAFLYEENEIYFQEIALYKLSSKIFMKGDIVEKIIRKCVNINPNNRPDIYKLIKMFDEFADNYLNLKTK